MVVLICISLIIRDVEHFFHVLAGHLYVFLGEMSFPWKNVFSLEKCLFLGKMSFAHFFIFFVFCFFFFAFLLLSCINCLYILEIVSCLIWKDFLPFCKLPFCFPFGFLCCAKAFQFDEVPWVYFCSNFYCFGRLTWENIHKVDVRECFAYVLFQEFDSVLFLTLTAILSLLSCMVWGFVLVSLICIQLSSFPSNACWKD